jgi:hypothetical protein
MEPNAAPSAPAAAPSKAPRRNTGAFRCFPGSSRGRIQGLLGQHYPTLWGEIHVKWLPTARPIAESQVERTGGYERGTLADVLIGLGEAGREWDGFEVCHTLRECYGWACDFHLAALIHAWSRGLADKLRS